MRNKAGMKFDCIFEEPLDFIDIDYTHLNKTIRYEKRQHGEWIEVPKYKGYYVCSECLKRLDGDFERFEYWEMRKDNFCHVCGSDNRKKEGDEK